jgi:prolyl oligopeptidase
LDALPERAAFLSALQTQRPTAVSDVTIAGDRSIFRRISKGDRVPKLIVRDADGRERILVDPNASQGSVLAINNTSVSPDGRRVAVQTASGGGEIGSIQVYDVASGAAVGPSFANIWGESQLVWFGGDVVGYTRLADHREGVDPFLNEAVYVKTLTDKGLGTEVLSGSLSIPGFTPADLPMLWPSALSDWVLGLAGGAHPAARIYVSRKRDVIGGHPHWQLVADLDRHIVNTAAIGDSLYLLSTATNPYGTLQRQMLPVDATHAPETILEGDATRILDSGLQATRRGLYLTAQRDGVSRLLFLPAGGTTTKEIPLAIEGHVVDMKPTADESTVTFGLVGWLTNTVYYRLDVDNAVPLGLVSETWPGASRFTTIREEVTSADGTKVPLVIIAPKTRTNSRPTMLTSYGSYGISQTTPAYSRTIIAWLEKGGVMAYCGTRGGGERGSAWYEAGQGPRKVNAHADLIACAERLRLSGVAPARGVVAYTSSAGGLLEGPAILKRPDLFAAAVLNVAILNPTRLAAAENGANQYTEMGDPATPQGYAGLKVQDAYVAIPGAKDVPDTLLTVGLNDQRVSPWMTAKFAARAQQRFGRTRAILVLTNADAGHGFGSADDAVTSQMADIFAFAWSRATKR